METSIWACNTAFWRSKVLAFSWILPAMRSKATEIWNNSSEPFSPARSASFPSARLLLTATRRETLLVSVISKNNQIPKQKIVKLPLKNSDRLKASLKAICLVRVRSYSKNKTPTFEDWISLGCTGKMTGYIAISFERSADISTSPDKFLRTTPNFSTYSAPLVFVIGSFFSS